MSTPRAAAGVAGKPLVERWLPLAALGYLVALATAVFFITDILAIGGVLLGQAALGLWLHVPLAPMMRLVRKLVFFLLFMLVMMVFLPLGSAPTDQWSTAHLGFVSVGYNRTGLVTAVLMAFRLLAVLTAAVIVREKVRPSDLVRGLRALRAPEIVALTIDGTLAAMSSDMGKGARQSRGEGRHKGGGHGDWRDKRLANNTSSFRRLINLPQLVVSRVEEVLSTSEGGLAPGTVTSGVSTAARDAHVLAGICAVMLTWKMVSVLPGIPFAPGHKTTLLIPLYVLAAHLTVTRWGATIAGGTMGIISFLLGDGRFGPLEALKHVTPGLVVDLMFRFRPRQGAFRAAAFYTVLGTLAGAARTSTDFAVAWFLGGNPGLYMLAGARALSHVAFGAAGGLVSAAVVQSLSRGRKAIATEVQSNA